MEFNKIIKRIAKDVADVQHNSDILAQWPISSVEAMYYSGPFFIPLIGKNISLWGNKPEDLYKQKLFPGKLSNLIFYFLSEESKEKMGVENHKILLQAILSKIMVYKLNNYLDDYKSPTWMPKWNLNKNAKREDIKKLVFLLDNLAEMINPIFRTFGVQLFFDNKNVYRYYHRLDLDFNIIIVSSKEEMQIDFFEHIIKSENLDYSQVYIEKDSKIDEVINHKELFDTIKNKIEGLKNSKFDRNYVINQIYSAYNYEIPKEQINFLKTSFPKQIINFYVKTCKMPTDKLELGIQKVLGL